MKKAGTDKTIPNKLLTGLGRVLSLSALLLAACVLKPAALQAEVPVKFTYQGNLRQSGYLVNGQRSMVFRIYASSTSATELWTSPAYNVNLSTGVFRVALEPVIADWQSGGLWLELEIAGNRLAPREELTSSPYAINSLLFSGKKYTSGASAPPAPNAGDLWMDTALNVLSFWSGSGWTSTAGSGAAHAATHAGGGGDALTALGTHTVTGAAGYGGDLLVLSTGTSGVIRLTGAGGVYANSFYGDGSGLTGLTAAGDNLGDHLATAALNMAGFNIAGAAALSVSSVTTAAAGVTFSTNVFIAGNVGLGLAGATARLEIKGADTQAYSLAVGTGTAHQVVVSTSGAVGIGTGTPRARLDVGGSDGAGQYIAIFNSGAKLAAWLRNK